MKHELFGITIDDIADDELKEGLETWLLGDLPHLIVTPNPEFLLLACRNKMFKNLLNKSDLSLPDGVGLRFAVAALTNNNLKHRHTGVDLVETLAKLSQATQNRILLIGGLPGSANKTKQHLQKLYPTLDIESIDPGKIKGDIHQVELESSLVEKIIMIKPNILIAGLGQGKQEQFIEQIRHQLPTLKIAIGVGGAFDMLSGIKLRAPKLFQRIGLEWMWRLGIEPKRFQRIFDATIIFPLIVVWGTLKQRRFLKACIKVIPEIYHQLIGL